MIRIIALLFIICVGPAFAQTAPLRIEITDGVIEPLAIAIPDFQAENEAAVGLAQTLPRIIAADLVGTGLFREIPASAHIRARTSFDQAVSYPDWRAINARGLITGAVRVEGGRIIVKFRLFDISASAELGQGQQLAASTDAIRRMAHKVADQVYARITGEGPYFDSRVVFVSETGPKDDRRKRLGVMDYDGQNAAFLTSSDAIVLNPRFSPDGQRILYTSYETGSPQIYVLDVGSVSRQRLGLPQGTMSFGPRFAPDGDRIIFSLEQGGNTDLYTLSLSSNILTRLTDDPSIETSASYSPDGTRIVFESDRSGRQQLYTMPAAGGPATRISFGEGRYSTPVWSPRNDLIAFTKQSKGRFGIGVIKPDGSDEQLLTASFLDEGPTWSPNGRVIMFTRETQGAQGAPGIYSVDITGRNLKPLTLGTPASEPSWGPVQ